MVVEINEIQFRCGGMLRGLNCTPAAWANCRPHPPNTDKLHAGREYERKCQVLGTWDDTEHHVFFFDSEEPDRAPTTDGDLGLASGVK